MEMHDHEIQIHEEERGTYFLLKFTGSLMAKNILLVRKKFEYAFQVGHSKIALDLSAVDYMDSTGLGLLINATKTTEKQGGKLILFNPSQTAFNLFTATNTIGALQIRNSVQDPDSLFD